MVHLSAHATVEGIYLKDGLFTQEDLAMAGLQGVRCRLLTLSACNAGAIEHPYAFLWAIVAGGVNVVAALDAVHDYVTSVFFESLYAEFFPRRRAQDIELGIAIRGAVERCRRRFVGATNRKGLSPEFWQSSVNSYILYGDPTLKLTLASR